MTEVSEQNKWLKLLRKGRVAWNNWACFTLGQAQWNLMINKLPEDYDSHLIVELKESSEFIGQELNIELSLYSSGNLGHYLVSIDFRREDFEDEFDVYGFVFPKQTFFVDCKFQKNCNFSRAVFMDYVRFSKSKFHEIADFQKTVFLNDVSFRETSFHQDLFFDDAFLQGVDFKDANVKLSVNFNRTRFKGRADFENIKIAPSAQMIFAQSTFSGVANFRNVEFLNFANFTECTFNQTADFSGVGFHQEVYFQKTNFKHNAIFKNSRFLLQEHSKDPILASPSFIGAKFESIADFEKAEFKAPPHFEGVEANAIFFNKAKFENIEDHTLKPLYLSRSAWLALMRLMDKVHDFDMKQDFHIKLLEIERLIEKKPILQWLYTLYKILGSGRAVYSPILGWLGVFLLCSIIYFVCSDFCFPIFNMNSISYFTNQGLLIHSRSNSDLNIVLKNTLSFTVIHSAPFMILAREGAMNYLNNLGASTIRYAIVTFVSFIQTIASYTLLFITGLALRNRFRIKA